MNTSRPTLTAQFSSFQRRTNREAGGEDRATFAREDSKTEVLIPSSGSESDMAELIEDMPSADRPLLGGEGATPVSKSAAGANSDAGELSSVVVHDGTEEAGGVDEITAAASSKSSTYGATDEVTKAGDKGKDKGKKKKEKTGQKAVSDALKTDMASERTFFKWLWTGLHTGAIGSFIFIAFDGDKSDPTRVIVVGFSWLVALALVLYGAFAFYRRRHALRTGDISVIPTFSREHSPLIVVTALALVVGTALVYAWKSNGYDAERAKDVAGNIYSGG